MPLTRRLFVILANNGGPEVSIVDVVDVVDVSEPHPSHGEERKGLGTRERNCSLRTTFTLRALTSKLSPGPGQNVDLKSEELIASDVMEMIFL